jgi:hypothetical protein
MMQGDSLDRGFSLTSWPLVLLILILVAIAVLDVDPNVAAILKSVTDRL